MPVSIRVLVKRLLGFYTGSINRNTIEYWQAYIFNVMAFIGIFAGFLAVVPSFLLVYSRGNRPGAFFLLILYCFCALVIFTRRIPIRGKTLMLAFIISFFGVMSLLLGGPVGGYGVIFSIGVLLCSHFAGFKMALLMASINFLAGMTIGVLYLRGWISWEFIKDYRFTSWLLQNSNIFLMSMIFSLANTLLLRGVGQTFRNLSKAEKRVLSSLAEKETLIRELYHRSKNNMQVVSSLLRLHSSELPDEAAQGIFKDIINKIVSMSLVHQKLYESRDLSNIDMADYIRDLVSLLIKSYGIHEDKVEVVYDLEEISLLIDTAIPCGLVISEIVANICKYAFPDDRKGRISVSLKSVDEDTVELSLADDGVGFPDGFSVPLNGKMGLKTLFTIVEHQLQGSINFRSANGLSYVIRFKRELYDERIKLDE